jgi:hypothetical protein
MMGQTAHTPTPWKHVARPGGWDGVDGADGTPICQLEYNVPGNATFIVRAVNSHETLVSALREADDYISALKENFSTGDAEDATQVLANIRTALSTAEGRPE